MADYRRAKAVPADIFVSDTIIFPSFYHIRYPANSACFHTSEIITVFVNLSEASNVVYFLWILAYNKVAVLGQQIH